jgi:hypothetical protein
MFVAASGVRDRQARLECIKKVLKFLPQGSIKTCELIFSRRKHDFIERIV